MMLHPRGIGVADDALSPYAHPQRCAHSRVVAEHVVELGDEVVWAMLLNERCFVTTSSKGKEVVELSTVLDAYKVVYGNRRTKSRRRPTRRKTLAGVRSGEVAGLGQGRLL